MKQIIGSGSGGKVWEAKFKDTDQKIAVKEMGNVYRTGAKNHWSLGEISCSIMQREVRIMAAFNHPTLMPLIGLIESHDPKDNHALLFEISTENDRRERA